MNCHSGKRYISFFEIIGFKSWIEIEGSKNVFDYVKGYLNMMIESSLPNAKVNADMSVDVEVNLIDFAHFANTVIFYSKDDSSNSFEALVKSSTEFINVVMAGVSIMTKGTIAYGEFYVDMETNTYIGQALVDAYSLNSEVDWMGLCLDETVINTDDFTSFINKNPKLIRKSLTATLNRGIYPLAINWADKKYLKDISFNAIRSLDQCLERRRKELVDDQEEIENISRKVNLTKEFLLQFQS